MQPLSTQQLSKRYEVLLTAAREKSAAAFPDITQTTRPNMPRPHLITQEHAICTVTAGLPGFRVCYSSLYESQPSHGHIQQQQRVDCKRPPGGGHRATNEWYRCPGRPCQAHLHDPPHSGPWHPIRLRQECTPIPIEPCLCTALSSLQQS